MSDKLDMLKYLCDMYGKLVNNPEEDSPREDWESIQAHTRIAILRIIDDFE